MAEINMPQKARRRAQAPRIDFTPVVDLGFLLITFFMITTAMATPKTLQVNMPSDAPSHERTVYPDESTITLVPAAGHNVVYYYGALNDDGQLKTTALTNIRAILLKKKKEIASLPASYSAQAHKLHVLIKPNDDCKYQDVVSLVDEMSIIDAPYYAITDVAPAEKEMIQKKFSRNFYGK